VSDYFNEADMDDEVAVYDDVGGFEEFWGEPSEAEGYGSFGSIPWSGEQQAIFGWFAQAGSGNLIVRARAGTGKTTTILEGITRAPERYLKSRGYRRPIIVCAFNTAMHRDLIEKLCQKGCAASKPGPTTRTHPDGTLMTREEGCAEDRNCNWPGWPTSPPEGLPYAEARTLNSLGNSFLPQEIRGRNGDMNARARDCAARGATAWFSGSARVAWYQKVIDPKTGLPTVKTPVIVERTLITRVANIAEKMKGMDPLILIRWWAGGPSNFKVAREITPIMERFELSVDSKGEMNKRFKKLGITNGDLAVATLYALEAASGRPEDGDFVDDGLVIGFEDQIFMPLVNDWTEAVYPLVIVDEAQDMNVAQLLLAQQVTAPGGRICVVGDDRQAIYGFRGADSESIDRLKTELRGIEAPLTVTRRCPQAVVALAAVLVPDFQAAPNAPEGYVFTDVDWEKTMIPNAAPGDFIIGRLNAPLFALWTEFIAQGRPAYIRGKTVGGELKGVIQKLTKRQNLPIRAFRERVDIWREQEEERLQDAGKQALTAMQDMAMAMATLSATSRDTNDVLALLEELISAPPPKEHRAETRICLTNVHQVKGAESNTVWILDQTFYPFSRDTEEQNLEYVALTRSACTLLRVINMPEDLKPKTKEDLSTIDNS
jgi:hypothetical protein